MKLTQGAHGQKRYPNVSFFLARNGGCIKMPSDEQKCRNRPENHARSAIASTDNCISQTTTQRGINKIPKCFSCPSNSKELSKKTKRSTYDSNKARTKPWPTRPLTSDSNTPITKRIRHQNVSLTLAIVAECRRKQGGRNQGSSQLQWLTPVECKLTSRTTNSKYTKLHP